ncbi:Aromatic peroxygenase [Phytophthora citrophthora]|uniref:Aromatic peroxygenase n=1 Tax=Phytophthora citrophthora TaxID=4793 RepID=A0AAD9LKW8_9STRA|nr:Aromatic peroxygenase [Phytophthora citrophthora]
MTTTTLLTALMCGVLGIALNTFFVEDNPQLVSLTTGQHEYFRPKDDDVGNNSFIYSRSPCPALNALANHGYIPRNGKELTPTILGDGLMKVFNIDEKLLDVIFLAIPSNFTLSDLKFINHDASLVHVDEFFQVEPFKVNETLADELFASAEGGQKLTKQTLSRFRRLREIECARTNPRYSMSALASFVAYGEAAFVLLGLGDCTSASISVEHARSFLVNERIPVDFRPSKTPVTITSVLVAIVELKLRAWLGL